MHGQPLHRCEWAGDGPLYQQYHDQEWGVPCYEDSTLFEFLLLEGAQAGLSWITILRKREGYRRLFDNFDAGKIAQYDQTRIDSLLQDPAIIRNRLKVNSAVTNARLFLELQAQHGQFSDYIWQFVNGKPIVNHWASTTQVPATTAESDAMAKALKKLGFKFVGSTICYAYMQATGMVNDHTVDCFRHGQV